tara:strand:- start:29 stop:139 length:111 start_codon:yes stop_codon:yes gene_type:complete
MLEVVVELEIQQVELVDLVVVEQEEILLEAQVQQEQ